MPDQKSPSEWARRIIDLIRAGNKTYQQMLDTVTQEGMDRADAEKLLDVLTKPVEDEDEEDGN